MGEGWSDWYAQDFLVGQFPSLDTGAAGEVDMGAYVNASSRLRSSALDCPVDASPVACPGRGAAGSGGYTYGDFGRVFGSAEVHYDGEIWAQVLWDLRDAVGSAKARALVTAGMRLLPPEPSFLDARNGILLADQALYAGADVGALWGVFAPRGMGFFAASLGGEDTAPAEDFSLPPGPEAPRGTITGRVTSALGGGPVAGVTIGLGGVSGFSATTDADGRFAFEGVPAGTYPKVNAGGAGWDAEVSSLAVPGGGTIAFNPVLRRDWAAARGGAVVTDSNGREYTSNGCGPSAAVDQSLGTAWSTQAGAGEKFLVVRLPETIDITQFGLDPGEGCGDTAASATGAYLVETSPDGVGVDHRRQQRLHQRRAPPAQLRHADGGRHRRPLRAPDAALLAGLRRPVPRHVRVRRLRPGRGRGHRGARDDAGGGRPAVRVLLERAGHVRVQARRGRVRGVHVAVPGDVARRRAHVLGAGGRCGRQP